MTGVTFSAAPATRAAPTAGRSGRVTPSIVRSAATSRSTSRSPAARRTSLAELGSEPLVEVGGEGADAAPDALGLAVAGHAGSQRRRHVGMGALHRPDHRAVAVALLQPEGELAGQVRPQVGVVLVRLHRDAGAVHGEHHGGGEGPGARPRVRLVVDRVDAHEVEGGVDRDPLALRVGASVGDRVVVDVRVVRPVAGQTPHVGAADREPGGPARVVGLDDGAGDALDELLGPGRVEPRPVRRPPVVEVGAEELARPGVGVRRTDPQSGDRDVGALRDRLGHEVLDDRRPAEQVALHERQRRRPGPQVQDPRPQARAEPVPEMRIGRVARLRQPRRRRDVHLRRTSQQPVDPTERGGHGDLDREPHPPPRRVDERPRAATCQRPVPSPTATSRHERTTVPRRPPTSPRRGRGSERKGQGRGREAAPITSEAGGSRRSEQLVAETGGFATT